jgi:uncharacterized protein (DUF2267 family)
MALNFDQFAQEGNKFLKDFSQELSHPENRERSARVLTSLLHSVRDLLTLEENVDVIAQLPMFLKAVYVQGWSPKGSRDKRVRTIEDFIKDVRVHDGRSSEYDFESDDEVERATAVMFMVLRRYITLGELEDIKAVLPKRLKPMLNAVTML